MKKTLALLIAIVLCVGGTSAQERYPQRPLRIVVPFAPGGSTDIIARMLGEQLSRSLGQPVVIENRPGAAGNIGAEAVARSAPDGYTLLMATTGVMAINNALYKNMNYDAATDFEYVVFVASITNVLIVAADSPLQSVGDLIAAAKRSPGRLSFASSGAGASTHMSAELFKIMAGVDLLHVPYKGSGPALPDVITGRVSMMFENMPGAMPYIRAGTVRPLAVTGLGRSSALPEVPTITESGVPGYESLSWSGIAVPAGTPRDVIARLNREINVIIASPQMRQRLADQGAEPVGGPPEGFSEHAKRERDKWSRVIRDANILVN
ncbi:MAG: tripartite tricarboxylate transporter substrate binding protein [Betaproteobacteria bacterium]|nr:MAG: tripartite tricarboxylate transporter substrate binding protein [Betaproteobacteria bacterium]